MQIFLLAIFDEIWPETMYYKYRVFGPIFEQPLRIHKKSKFNQNQLKLSKEHVYMYVYQKKL